MPAPVTLPAPRYTGRALGAAGRALAALPAATARKVALATAATACRAALARQGWQAPKGGAAAPALALAKVALARYTLTGQTLRPVAKRGAR